MKKVLFLIPFLLVSTQVFAQIPELDETKCETVTLSGSSGYRPFKMIIEHEETGVYFVSIESRDGGIMTHTKPEDTPTEIIFDTNQTDIYTVQFALDYNDKNKEEPRKIEFHYRAGQEVVGDERIFHEGFFYCRIFHIEVTEKPRIKSFEEQQAVIKTNVELAIADFLTWAKDSSTMMFISVLGNGAMVIAVILYIINQRTSDSKVEARKKELNEDLDKGFKRFEGAGQLFARFIKKNDDEFVAQLEQQKREWKDFITEREKRLERIATDLYFVVNYVKEQHGIKKEEEKEIPAKHKCDDCDMEFAYQQELSIHIMENHKDMFVTGKQQPLKKPITIVEEAKEKIQDLTQKIKDAVSPPQKENTEDEYVQEFKEKTYKELVKIFDEIQNIKSKLEQERKPFPHDIIIKQKAITQVLKEGGYKQE